MQLKGSAQDTVLHYADNAAQNSAELHFANFVG